MGRERRDLKARRDWDEARTRLGVSRTSLRKPDFGFFGDNKPVCVCVCVCVCFFFSSRPRPFFRPYHNPLTIRKMMAAVHFTTIPCEPNRALAHIESYILAKVIPVLTKLCMQGLKFSDLSCEFL